MNIGINLKARFISEMTFRYIKNIINFRTDTDL